MAKEVLLATPYEPSKELPRDESGSLLHLKLKRYPTKDDLTMAFAKKTWTEHPQDAEMDIAQSSRSICRQCHEVITKGNLRARLWLQCYKGCKNSAYFHGKVCIWKYPETVKLENIKEFVGLEALPAESQKYVEEEFARMKNGPTAKKRKKEEVGTEEASSKKKFKKHQSQNNVKSRVA